MTCEHCDGFWMQTENGMRRCTYCQKGRDLAAADEARRNPTGIDTVPAITDAESLAAVVAMGAMRYFPSDPAVRGVIQAEVRSLCHTVEDALWLARRMNALYREWPGLIELRIVFCGRKIPHDGVMATAISEAYLDGVPSEQPTRDTSRHALPPGARSQIWGS